MDKESITSIHNINIVGRKSINISGVKKIDYSIFPYHYKH